MIDSVLRSIPYPETKELTKSLNLIISAQTVECQQHFVSHYSYPGTRIWLELALFSSFSVVGLQPHLTPSWSRPHNLPAMPLARRTDLGDSNYAGLEINVCHDLQRCLKVRPKKKVTRRPPSSAQLSSDGKKTTRT